MKRVWRLSSDAESLFSQILLSSSNPKSTTAAAISSGFTRRHLNTLQQHHHQSPDTSFLVSLFTVKHSPAPSSKEELIVKATVLKNKLVREASDSVRFLHILDENSDSLNRPFPGGSVLLELLNQLDYWPSLALKVLIFPL